ncbi:YciI-like protein [Hoeflea poritis]|uniref:YciI-like protein n=1 Tax=Hoeflea poritis TaxID=2993659 RepID=A0ABT4VL90_9HYPH|nr:YciI-like protein [Hoeflea poritis]MDA4845487.1 YciI-like protein [Hoeflea poritis]
MLFALICTDKPDSLDLRMEVRPDHVAYLNTLNENGVLKLAGPFLDENEKPDGSLVVIEAGSREEAHRIAADDPYSKADLFASVDIRPYNWVFNKPGE